MDTELTFYNIELLTIFASFLFFVCLFVFLLCFVFCCCFFWFLFFFVCVIV